MNLRSPPGRRSWLVVWDAEGSPPVGDWTTVLWSEFGDAGSVGVVSLPKLVEEHSETLRARYLAWIHELGEARIRNKRLLDHMELRPGFSYWWMTLLVEKSYAKSPRFNDAAKFLALEAFARESAARRITLVSGDRTLVATFRRWCARAGICLEWRQSRKHGSRLRLRPLYRSLPYPAQSAISLARYLLGRWPVRKLPQPSDGVAAAEITFVDYLAHLDRRALVTGQFASNYWTQLPGVLNQARRGVNWLHLYAQHEAVQTPREAGELVARFNHNGAGLERHVMLDRALGVSVVLGALCDYARLAWRASFLGRIGLHFRVSGSDLDFWPLFEHDWLN